jgi:hypothetical protein
MERFTPIQFASARRIARFFGHLWAEATDAWEPACWTRRQVDDACAKVDDQYGGVYCPAFDAQRVVQSRTGTRRLVWSVAPDGQVVISVERPHPGSGSMGEPGTPVLRAWLSPAPKVVNVLAWLAGEREVQYQLVDLEELSPSWAWRHWSALADLLEEFIGREETEARRFELAVRSDAEAGVAPEELWLLQDRLEGVRQRAW